MLHGRFAVGIQTLQPKNQLQLAYFCVAIEVTVPCFYNLRQVEAVEHCDPQFLSKWIKQRSSLGR
jgi:hypothetical protein